MVFVRILLLIFLVAYSWSMGQIPPDGLNAFGKLVAGLFFVAAPALYLLPTYEAYMRGHTNLTGIALVNVFLGWTLLGWLVAIAWAHKKPEATPVYAAVTEPPAPFPVPARETRTCPFCAEEILAAAVKCKHCGSRVEALHSPSP